MIVRPGILHHPKYQALKVRFGDAALSYLVAIWEHCELVKGANWGPVGAKYVETVARFRGRKGELFKMLLDPFEDGSKGWIELVPTEPELAIEWGETPENSVESRRHSSVLVHDWAEVNIALLRQRDKGRLGGLRKALQWKGGDPAQLQPSYSPAVAQAQPGSSSTVAYGEEGRGVEGEEGSRGSRQAQLSQPTLSSASSAGAEIPSLEEFLTLTMRGIPEPWLRDKYAYMTSRDKFRFRDAEGRVRVTDWRGDVPRWFSKDRGEVNGASASGPAGGTAEPAWVKIRELEAAVASNPTNKNSSSYQAGLEQRDPEKFKKAADGFARARHKLAELKALND